MGQESKLDSPKHPKLDSWLISTTNTTVVSNPFHRSRTPYKPATGHSLGHKSQFLDTWLRPAGGAGSNFYQAPGMDRHLIKWPNSSQLVLNPLSIKTHVLHIPLTVNYRASRAWAEHLYFMEGTGIRDPEIDLFCNRFNLLLDEPKKPTKYLYLQNTYYTRIYKAWFTMVGKLILSWLTLLI